MKKTVQKLNKLKNPGSFIQINTIKGFKYVDKAGEIVNFYHKNNSAPQFQMGLNGLVIEQPKDKIDELKVTAHVIWAKFSKIDSLDSISTLFAKESEGILKIWVNTQNVGIIDKSVGNLVSFCIPDRLI